jgi:CrcB protein
VLGALTRYGLGLAVPSPDNWPLPTLVINVTGAFALGALLEGLARRGSDAGRRRVLRLALGTGFLGAYTTYSTLALDTVHLITSSDVAGAAWYTGTTVLGGAAATTAGIWLAANRHRRSLERRNPGDQGVNA